MPAETVPELRVERIRIPRLVDERGALLPLDFASLPFQPRRMFLVQDVPPGQQRGGHAHRRARQLLVCLSGRIRVELRGPHGPQLLLLDRPDEGLLVPALTWSAQTYLDPGSMLLVLASEAYDPDSYLFDAP